MRSLMWKKQLSSCGKLFCRLMMIKAKKQRLGWAWLLMPFSLILSPELKQKQTPLRFTDCSQIVNMHCSWWFLHNGYAWWLPSTPGLIPLLSLHHHGTARINVHGPCESAVVISELKHLQPLDHWAETKTPLINGSSDAGGGMNLKWVCILLNQLVETSRPSHLQPASFEWRCNKACVQ